MRSYGACTTLLLPRDPTCHPPSRARMQGVIVGGPARRLDTLGDAFSSLGLPDAGGSGELTGLLDGAVSLIGNVLTGL